VDDEDLQDAFTGIVRATGSVSTAMKDMGLVTDLMRGKNLNAAKAGDVLAKVHNGNVTALKRYGIALDPVTKAQDKLKASNKDATVEQVRAAKAADKAATAQAGIAELQKRFGGQAEAYGKTAAGAQDRFAVAMENVQEKLGAKLLPVLGSVANAVSKFLSEIDRGTGAGGRFAAVVSDGFAKVRAAVEAALPTAVAAFENLRAAVTSVVSTVTGVVRGFQEGKGGAVALVAAVTGLTTAFVAYRVAVGVAAAVTKAYAAVQAALNVVMTANPIGLVVVGLVGLGAALVVAYKKSETFRKVVDATWAAVRDTTMTVLNWLVPAVKAAFGVVADVVRVAVGIVKGYVHVYAAAAKAIVTAIIDAFNFLKALPGKVAGFLSDTTKKIRGWVGNFADAAVDLGKGIGKGIIDGLGDLGHLILGKVKDALGFVADNVKKGAGAIGGAIGSLVGDGVGKSAGALGGGLPAGTFGGGLKGARPSWLRSLRPVRGSGCV
jgi:phage-related protein